MVDKKGGRIEMKKLKIVLMGAGSGSFGRGTIADIMASKELNEFDLTVSLVDIDEEALDRMFKFAKLLKDYHKSNAKLEATTNRLEALPNANYVIAALSMKRYQLWEQDFLIPYAYGFRHIYGECGGPGADFHTLRSFHITVPIAKDMEKLCPDALLLNFTNPENRVAMAVNKLTKIKCVGLCHGPISTHSDVADILGRSEDDIEIDVGGLNHFHWVMNIRDKSNGQDLMPLFRQKMSESDFELDTLTRRLYEIFGLLPFPSSSHTGEYVSFAYEICGPVYMSWKEEIHTLEEEKKYGVKLFSKSRIQRVVDGEEPLTDELAEPSAELAIPIICDIEYDLKRRELSVNIPNDGFAISNMPEDAVVEIPAVVDAEGLHPVKVGALPEGIVALCNKQVSIHKLLVEAYKERSKKILLQAMMLEPVVDSIDRAEKMIDEMLRIEANFIPEFK
jgi:alpha-galactosidase